MKLEPMVRARSGRPRWLPALWVVGVGALLLASACGEEGVMGGGAGGAGGGLGGSLGMGGEGAGGAGGTPQALPPEVLSILPPDGATEVSRSTTIRITFDRRMDPAATEAATRVRADGASVPFSATWRESFTVLILEPVELLPEESRITVRVSTAATDAAGDFLGGAFESAFFTGAGADPGEPGGEGRWGTMRWNQGEWR